MIVNSFLMSKKRLIILEYDGVLVPFAALPSLSRPPRKLISTLRALASDPNTLVYVFSGRDRKTVDNWFPPAFNIGASAEQGCYIRFSNNQKADNPKSEKSDKPEKDAEWELLYPDLDLTWRDMVRPLMQHYTIRTPGTFVEETEVQMVWHHRNAEEPFGSTQSRDLHHLLDNIPVAVEVKDKRLGVRPLNVNQSSAFRRIWFDIRDEVDFVFVVGDFNVGVDMMDLPEKTFIFGIGKSGIEGKWTMADPDEVSELLDDLAHVKN